MSSSSPEMDGLAPFCAVSLPERVCVRKWCARVYVGTGVAVAVCVCVCVCVCVNVWGFLCVRMIYELHAFRHVSSHLVSACLHARLSVSSKAEGFMRACMSSLLSTCPRVSLHALVFLNTPSCSSTCCCAVCVLARGARLCGRWGDVCTRPRPYGHACFHNSPA
jgi:hypothetical protein